MNADYKKIKNDRQWKATTGLSKNQFEILSSSFSKTYIDVYGQSLKKRQKEGPMAATFTTPKELLFFLLFSFKTGLGQDALGFVFGLDGSNVSRNKKMASRILRAGLIDLGVMPKREFTNVEEFEEYFKEHASLILDGTEQRVQRPGNQQVQKDFYSGKKNATP